MKKYLKIYWQLIKFAAIEETTYRTDFFMEWCVELAYITVVFIGARVVFWNVDQVAGWDFNQMLVLLGVNAIFAEIILGVAFVFNLRELPGKIARGDLDLALVKPLSSQFMASLWRPYFALVPSLLPGLLMIYLGFQRGGFSFNPVLLLPFSIIFISGLVMAYSIGMVLVTLSFWLVNAWALPQMAEHILHMAERPYSIFAGFWRVVFLLFLPIAFMVSFPAQTLLGDWQWWWPLVGVILALGFLKASNLFWNFGLRSYSGASA